MFLIIFEDGQITCCTKVSDELFSGADDGIVDIVDVSDPVSPLRYWGGDWEAVESLGQ